MKKNKLFILFFLCLFYFGDAQIKLNYSFIISVGTHQTRLGSSIAAIYTNNQFQSTSQLKLYYNLKNLGPNKSYLECLVSQSLIYSYGTKQINQKLTYNNEIINSTPFQNYISYTYNLYFNKIKTTQLTAVIAVKINSITIASENDILARPQLDRYRTAAIQVKYEFDSLTEIGTQLILWTGFFKHKSIFPNNTCFKNGCYMDTVDAKYYNYSHGIFALVINRNTSKYNTFNAQIGIDSEKVRNFVQNKVMHDLIFLPKKWIKNNNCHIPMVDSAGKIFLYNSLQKIKPSKPIINVGYNNLGFY